MKCFDISIRLDFVDFDIAQPTSGTECTSGAFQVSGASNAVPNICGSNSGQHSEYYVKSQSNSIKVTYFL